MNTHLTVHRSNKREKIKAFFRHRLHQPIPSLELHNPFGTTVRARISEINREVGPELVISNRCHLTQNGEVSLYTATPAPRKAQGSLFDATPARWRDDG
jgi:hypothetical protein